MDVEQFLDQPRLGFYIDGSFCSDPDRPEKQLISPLSNTAWKSLLPATYEDALNAILAAQKSFDSWKRTSSSIRAKYLRKLGDLINEHADQFAKLMATEMGKPITQGKSEAAYSAGYFYWFAGEAERIYGLTIPSQFNNKKLLISYEPVGVCAAITPWNFPLAMAARKIAAALAAGCTIINKPSTESPATMLLFAQLCQMAELPPGVVNIIPGSEEEIGKALLESNIVRKISFTGSTAVGKLLYKKSAATLKKLTLELGGHAPLIVCDDADIKEAAEQTILGKFRNNGQTCVCPNRIYVQETIYEAFAATLIEEISKLKLGDPFDENTDLTTILHPASSEKVIKQIEDALQKGAIAEHIGGRESYHPCILFDVTEDMLIYREETFGPLAALIKFKTDEEAVALANDSEFGLSSYVFTKNLDRAAKIVDALEYGIVGLNDGMPSTYQASFGGVKHSGFGREGGPTALREYLVEKFVSTRLS
jgi:succinate-semialdehyde dehydrogenase/glutarate-semialdehyde dehydrogenase